MAMKSHAPSAVARGFALGVFGGGLGVLGAVRVIKEIIVVVRDGLGFWGLGFRV
jgi:uncharacterized protein (DUF2062 family)